jgi:hypothetical protein
MRMTIRIVGADLCVRHGFCLEKQIIALPGPFCKKLRKNNKETPILFNKYVLTSTALVRWLNNI